MDLYLIRHAQSTNNVLDNVLDRHYDPDLTELGYRQADALAAYLANGDHDYSFGALYCSPMRRAMLTTKPVAAALGMTPQVWTDVFEYGGVFLEDRQYNVTGYPGMTRAEMQANFPGFDLPETVTEKGWWDVTWGRETKAACMDRTRRVVQAIDTQLQQDPNAQIAIVSHADFINFTVRELIGHGLPMNGEYGYRYHSDNTGITHLQLSTAPGWEPRLAFMNRVDHLPLGLR